MKLNLFATKLEENHTYIIKNIVKRIAAQDDYVRVNYQIDKISMLHPFHIEQRLEVHILQVEKYQVKETILRNTLIRHILIKVNVFCAPCHSIQLRQV